MSLIGDCCMDPAFDPCLPPLEFARRRYKELIELFAPKVLKILADSKIEAKYDHSSWSITLLNPSQLSIDTLRRVLYSGCENVEIYDKYHLYPELSWKEDQGGNSQLHFNHISPLEHEKFPQSFLKDRELLPVKQATPRVVPRRRVVLRPREASSLSVDSMETSAPPLPPVSASHMAPLKLGVLSDEATIPLSMSND